LASKKDLRKDWGFHADRGGTGLGSKVRGGFTEIGIPVRARGIRVRGKREALSRDTPLRPGSRKKVRRSALESKKIGN